MKSGTSQSQLLLAACLVFVFCLWSVVCVVALYPGQEASVQNPVKTQWLPLYTWYLKYLELECTLTRWKYLRYQL